MNSAGTQGLLSPQGTGMLSPLSVQKPHSSQGLPVSPKCRSVSPRLAFLLAHRHAEFHQPQGLCTCGPSAVTPTEFLPQPGFLLQDQQEVQAAIWGPSTPLSFPGLELWGLPGYLETRRSGSRARRQEAGQKSKGWRRWGVEGGRQQPPPGSRPLHPPPTPACCPESSP